MLRQQQQQQQQQIRIFLFTTTSQSINQYRARHHVLRFHGVGTNREKATTAGEGRAGVRLEMIGRFNIKKC